MTESWHADEDLPVIARFEVRHRACAYRKSSPSILVMQSTQDRTAQNAPRCLGGT